MATDASEGWIRLDNTSAFLWSMRLFLYGYLLAPLLLVAGFILYSSTQPYFSIEVGDLLFLVALLPLILVIGYLLTLYRTPRFLRALPGRRLRWLAPGRNIVELTIQEGAGYAVLDNYPPGFLLREQSELVEVRTGRRNRPVRLVVVEGLLDGVLPRRDRRFSRGGLRARQQPSLGEGPENGS